MVSSFGQVLYWWFSSKEIQCQCLVVSTCCWMEVESIAWPRSLVTGTCLKQSIVPASSVQFNPLPTTRSYSTHLLTQRIPTTNMIIVFATQAAFTSGCKLSLAKTADPSREWGHRFLNNQMHIWFYVETRLHRQALWLMIGTKLQLTGSRPCLLCWSNLQFCI